MRRAVVFDHLIGLEDVRPDLATEPDLFLFAHEGLKLRVLFLLLELVESGFHDLHRAILVFELGTLVLTLHDDAAGEMCNADGGLDFVDVLAPGSPGSERVDPQVLVLDHQLHIFLQFGVDKDRGERGMASLVRVEGGDAD